MLGLQRLQRAFLDQEIRVLQVYKVPVVHSVYSPMGSVAMAQDTGMHIQLIHMVLVLGCRGDHLSRRPAFAAAG